MNNIRQKNVILGMRHQTGIPYGSSEYVNQYSDCQNMTHVDINNAMRQLLDNDLFIERELNQASSYTVGPKPQGGMESGVDGYKAFGDVQNSETLDILRRANRPLSGTIQKVQAGRVAFVTVFSEVVFVGSSTGLWYSTDYSLSSPNAMSITATGFYQDDDVLLFSAGDGVYQLSVAYDEDESSDSYGQKTYSAVRLNSNAMTGLRSVYLDRSSGKLLAGGADRAYAGDYDPGAELASLASSIEFEDQLLFGKDGKLAAEPVAAVCSNGDAVIAGTKSGVFERENAVVFRNGRSLFQLSGEDRIPKSYSVVATFDDNVYAGAENGLFALSGDVFVPPGLAGGDISSKVVDIKPSDDAMYVATTSQVYSVSREMTRSGDYLLAALSDNRIPAEATISHVAAHDQCVYVGTDVGVYCFQPSQRPCIYEILTDGTVEKLPRSTAANSFDDVTDLCFAGNALLVGTKSGLFRFDQTGQSLQETTQIMSVSKYADSNGASIRAGGVTVKLLASAVSPYVYVVMENGICRADDLNGVRWLAPGGSGEKVADAQFAQIDGQTYVLAVTSLNTYLLSPDSLKAQAVPADRTPGTACCCSEDVIVVAGADGKCLYSHNSIDEFRSSGWKTTGAGVDQFELHADGTIYGVKRLGSAMRFSAVPLPAKASDYSGVSDWAWSSTLSGYLFVRSGRLVYRQFACEYELDSDGEPGEIHFSVADEADVWSSDEISANAVYACDDTGTVFLGTQSGLMSADLAGIKSATAAFAQCSAAGDIDVGQVYDMCRGYTGANDHGQAYSSWNYVALRPDGDGYVEETVDAQSGSSLLVASENGLFEIKLDGDGLLEKVSDVAYKAMCATPSLFVGVSRSNVVYTCVNEFDGTEETLDAGQGIQPGTASGAVVYTKISVKSTQSLRQHDEPAPDSVRSIDVFMRSGKHVICMAGGMAAVIQNEVPNARLGSFQFSPSKYGYQQDSVDVMTAQSPKNAPQMAYYSKTYSYLDELDDGASREVTAVRTYSACPTNALFGQADSYSGYFVFASDGLYVEDVANVGLRVQELSSADGRKLSSPVALCRYGASMFVACGEGEGLQSVDGSVSIPDFVVEDMRQAGDNFYLKTGAGWSYLPCDSVADVARPELSAKAPAVSDASPLDEIFETAGIAPGSDAYFATDYDGTPFIGTLSDGLFVAEYFSYQLPQYRQSAVPAALSSANVFSVNPSSKSQTAAVVVYDYLDDACEIYKYSLGVNSAKLAEFESADNESPVTSFRRAYFTNRDCDAVLYAVDQSGRLCQVETRRIVTPDLDETFYDMGYVAKHGETFAVRDGYVMSFGGISENGSRFVRIADTGRVNGMAKADGKCLIAASDGIWQYRTKRSGTATGQGECACLRRVPDGVDSIATYEQELATRYVCTSGQDTLSSANYKLWRNVLSWSSVGTSAPTGISALNGVYRLDDRTYFAAADNGLYMTKQAYEVVRDVSEFTKDDALCVYNRLFQSVISADVSAALSAHVSPGAGDHSEDSVITQLNRSYLNVQLDNIDGGWSTLTLSNQVDGYVDVRNDIIGEMQFGEFIDGDVFAYASSYVTPSGPAQVDGLSYIMKRWTSGVTELYVNVPTTSSYYLANCYGASNCRHDQSDSYSRKNLEQFGAAVAVQDSTLSTHWTSLSVCVASASYHVDNLLDVQVNGMSLPLAIYKDQTSTGDTGDAGSMYRSFVEPSVVRKWDVSKTDEDGNYVFEFACFGTDAQAVKIMFYDEKSRTASDCVKVVFDANGGEGRMPNQKFVIVRDTDGKTILEQKNLRKCLFTNTSSGRSKIFNGWSVLPLADNSNAAYEDKAQFPRYRSGETFADLMSELGDPNRTDGLVRNEEIRLYAVWLDYQFSDDDTTLLMQSDKTEFYIDSVGVDPTTRLKDKVVISFGD